MRPETKKLLIDAGQNCVTLAVVFIVIGLVACFSAWAWFIPAWIIRLAAAVAPILGFIIAVSENE